MKSSPLIVLFLILCILTLSAGCSTASGKAAVQPTAIPTTQSPPANITYHNHGISFVYPDNLALTERDTSKDKTASWESGDVQLNGESENVTFSWMAMHHVPPNIPVVYESMRTSFQKDPKMSDVKFYLLETYPAMTCGDATFIGHVSFYNKVRKTPVNEGILLWYNPGQDRVYFIDMASGNDYKSYIQEALTDYQQSLRCADS